MISPDHFWDRLNSSGILTADRVRVLRGKIAAKPKVATSAVQIARALVANNILTEEQARMLLDVRSVSEAEPMPGVPEMRSVLEANSQVEARKNSSTARLCMGVAIAAMVTAVAFFYWPGGSSQKPALPPVSLPQIIPGDISEASNGPYALTDSHQELWARPLPGKPFEIAYLPPGTQMIVRIRMSQLLETAEGSKIMRSLGPNLKEQLAIWTKKIGVSGSDIQVLSLYLLPQGTTNPMVILHGELLGVAAEQFSNLGELDENRLIKLATNAIWCPNESPSSFYYGPWDALQQFPQSDSGQFRRELEQLHGESHDTDLVSILANPNFLRDEAQGLFPGMRQRLLYGLTTLWSDEAQAVSLGFQQEDLAFVEVRVIARDDLPPRHLAAKISAYLQGLPAQITDFLGNAILDQHWQPLAMRFPQMVSFVVDQTRIVVDGRQVAMTAIAPKEATHNLLLAAELGIATPIREPSIPIADYSNWSLDDVLTQKTSVRFAQKSLDQSIQDVSQQIREARPGLPFDFRIQIVGGDLEREGITRNQQIRDFHAVELTLAQILTALVTQANPTQGVASNDPEQKLVWVVSTDEIGLVEITTRAAALSKNQDLPEAFRTGE